MRHLKRGFTIIELMVAIAIITLLAGSLYVAMNSAFFESQDKAAKGLLGSIRIALEAYRGQFRAYPPDGIDYPVMDNKGRPIKNTACLLYFLTNKLPKVSRVGTEPLVNPVGPFMRSIQGEYLSGDLDGEDTHLIEIVDSWGNPLNYDNIGEGFSPLGGPAHHTMVGLEPYHYDDDPRDGEPQGNELYNLWSNGATQGADEDGAEVPDTATRFEDNLTSWGSF